jgi:hypothetical protein
VLQTENISLIRFGIATLFEAGSPQSAMFVERGKADVWRYYQVMRAGEGASSLALSSPASYANRISAIHRYIADLPTERDERESN